MSSLQRLGRDGNRKRRRAATVTSPSQSCAELFLLSGSQRAETIPARFLRSRVGARRCHERRERASERERRPLVMRSRRSNPATLRAGGASVYRHITLWVGRMLATALETPSRRRSASHEAGMAVNVGAILGDHGHASR